VERARVASAAPAEHFVAAINRAVERIEAGELTKVVLAREVRVHSPQAIDPAPVYDGLRTVFPSCYCYLVGKDEAAFVGASPELLVRRDGARAQTVALAGTRRRSADPAVDDHLAEQLRASPKDREEQAIVTRRIERALRPVSVWVAAAGEPVVVKVQNVQHLGTPIRAQLSSPVPCVELAGLLHPTPAVGGEPRDRALPLIPALEGLDRGWYAGPVGWTDLAEDGEFCVALRCALVRDRVAHLYAGEGIVRDSDPAQELEANEAKLQALLPLLT
jgi:isochorismate synthase